MKSFGKALDLLIVIAAAGLIPLLAAVLTRLLQPLLDFIDPDRAFGFASIHHIFQLLLTLLAMKMFLGTKLSEWGFNLRDWRRSLRITAWFCPIYLLPVFLYNVLPSLVTGEVPEFHYPLNVRNISGVLTMEYVLSGTGEEPLFRGFVITVLAQSWRGRVGAGRFSLSSAAILSTIIFMLAHAQITLSPFSFHVSIAQQLWAMGLGIFYAIVFEKTRSLLAPILCHGFSDGIIFTVLFAWALLAG